MPTGMLNPLYDPEYEKVARQLAEAQALRGEGYKGASGGGYQGGKIYIRANPWGNIAQGLAGAFMGNRAENQMADIGAKRNTERQQFADAFDNAKTLDEQRAITIAARNKGYDTGLERAFINTKEMGVLANTAAQLRAKQAAETADRADMRLDKTLAAQSDRLSTQQSFNLAHNPKFKTPVAGGNEFAGKMTKMDFNDAETGMPAYRHDASGTLGTFKPDGSFKVIGKSATAAPSKAAPSDGLIRIGSEPGGDLMADAAGNGYLRAPDGTTTLIHPINGDQAPEQPVPGPAGQAPALPAAMAAAQAPPPGQAQSAPPAIVPKMTAAQQKGVADAKYQGEIIDMALEAAKANPKAFGIENLLPGKLVQRLDPSGVTARSLVANLSSQIIKDRSGANVTAKEWPRLENFVPAVDDEPQAVVDKLKMLKRIMAVRKLSFGSPRSESDNPQKNPGSVLTRSTTPTVPALPQPEQATTAPKAASAPDTTSAPDAPMHYPDDPKKQLAWEEYWVSHPEVWKKP